MIPTDLVYRDVTVTEIKEEKCRLSSWLSRLSRALFRLVTALWTKRHGSSKCCSVDSTRRLSGSHARKLYRDGGKWPLFALARDGCLLHNLRVSRRERQCTLGSRSIRTLWLVQRDWQAN